MSDLQPGVRGVVRQLYGGQAFTGRLSSLGFTLGAEITIIRNDGHGPILVVVRGTRMALGFGEAAKILVEILAESTDSERIHE